jgi:hypothetical protein
MQCTYKYNIEAPSRNNCCRRKAISISYSECRVYNLIYLARNAHMPYYIVICGLTGPTIYFHTISDPEYSQCICEKYWLIRTII